MRKKFGVAGAERGDELGNRLAFERPASHSPTAAQLVVTVNETNAMDLLSAAAGAAAAGALAKLNKSSKEGVIGLILAPPAKALGEHFGQQVKQKLADAAAAKSESNVREHIEAVRPTISADADVDPQLFARWLDSAAKVDPADQELTAALRGTLDAMTKGSPYRAKLLETIGQLSPDEAAAFLNPRHFNDNHYRKRLRSLGLWQEFSEGLISHATAASLCILFGTAMMYLLFILVDGWTFQIPRSTLQPSAKILLGTLWLSAGAVLPLLWLIWEINKPRKTIMGRELAKYATLAMSQAEATQPNSASHPITEKTEA